MNGRGGRQFSRGGVGGPDPPRRRRFRGQYVRRRTPSGGYRAGSFSDDRNDSSPPPNRPMPAGPDDPSFAPPTYQNRMQRPHQSRGSRHYQQDRNYYDNSYQRQPQPPRYGMNNMEASDNEHGDHVGKLEELTRSYQGQKTDIDEIRVMFSKLSSELDQVKSRVKELESTPKVQLQPTADQVERENRRQSKLLKQREKKAAKLAEKRAAISEQKKILNPEQTTSTSDKPPEPVEVAPGPSKYNRRMNRERNAEKRKVRRDFKEKAPKTLPKSSANAEDSTTQAAEPSSEERPEGDEDRVKVLRRKKPHFSRRPYGNRRRRADSSERNSNDTSPQGETNGHEDYRKKTFPELSESELNEVVQALKREFVNLERPLKSIKSSMNDQGPKVVYEFAVSILDHAICDVTSPTKLTEIANNLYQLIFSEDNAIFQQGFYDALNDISKREDDIAIDAPRYMDTLGQVLAYCVIPMHTKHKDLKKFFNKCVESYCKQNRAVLLASIMKGVASVKTDRFAKETWDAAQLDWENYLEEGTTLAKFLKSNDVGFTTQAFSPEPRKHKKAPKELEKFADDVTSQVEKRCTPQELEDLVKELNLEPDERVDYLGTLIYAVVRGCLITDSSAYKLNIDALNKYSSILNAKHEEQDAIALYALAALTKLWHQYNCPQDLLRTILQALHNQGTASYEALNNWLNSESLTNIPGIGAARLNSKRYIEDLGANLKA